MKKPDIYHMEAEEYRHAMAAYSVKKRMDCMDYLFIFMGVLWFICGFGAIWSAMQKMPYFAVGFVAFAVIVNLVVVVANNVLRYMNVMTMMMYKDIEGKELDILGGADPEDKHK